MNKEKSLTFLQSCIEKVKKATEQDIQFYKEVYDKEYVLSNKNSEFEFVFPANDKYEINDEFELDICNQGIRDNKNQMEYNFLETGSFNQDASANLPYAA